MSLELNVEKSDTLPEFSDKCLLPPSFLETAISSHDSLPHPMVFILNNDILIGVREFTAPENTILVPGEIWSRLKANTVSCVLVSLLPKATSLRIRPAQFYPHVTNWKYYLESFLSTHYTTLSENQRFNYHDKVAGMDVEIMVDKASEPSVVVVDTDIVLDVAPLNDIMAAQQLQQESAMMKYEEIPEISSSVAVDLEPFNKITLPLIYKINLLQYPEMVSIQITPTDDLYNTDILCSLDKFLNLENFMWSTMDQDVKGDMTKTVTIDTKIDLITNTQLKSSSSDELWLYIVPFAWEHNSKVSINISTKPQTNETPKFESFPSQTQCGNCKSFIDSAKIPLHEAFCYRNNVRCSCGEVFPKAIPNTHWHCEKCPDIHGESALFKFKHDKLFHSRPYMCDKCDDNTEYSSFLELVQHHKANSCASRLHECQFCHLILPQGEATFEDRFLNLTHHENECGNKTAECYQCGKFLRNKDLASHMKIHEIVKTENNAEIFPKCANINCVNMYHSQENELGLCETCYGPLYLSILDPNNMKLQLRIERRYVLQLTKGCGNSWCRNIECANGNEKLDFKQALMRVKAELFPKISSPSLPANKGKATLKNNQFSFCVTESIQNKKNLVDQLVQEGNYGKNMIYKAVYTCGVESVREWLVQNAI